MDDDTFLQFVPKCAACSGLIGPNSGDSTTHYALRDERGRVGPWVHLHAKCALEHENPFVRQLRPGFLTIFET